MNDSNEKVRIKIISITRSGDEAVRHMVGHIDGIEFIYSDSVDDEMKIRNVLDGVWLSTLVFLITGIESETDTQVISKISHFTEIAHELGVLTIAIASASSPKLENKYNDLFTTFLCHIDESKTANEVLLESVKSIADLLTHPGIVACDISLFIYTLFAPDSMAFICTETAIGENRANDVTTKLLNSPLLHNVNLFAGGVYMLVCISTASALSVLEYEEVTNVIGMLQMRGSTTMKAGTSINPDLADNEMKVTIAITNIKKYNDESWWDDDDDDCGDDNYNNKDCGNDDDHSDNIDEIPAFLRRQLNLRGKTK